MDNTSAKKSELPYTPDITEDDQKVLGKTGRKPDEGANRTPAGKIDTVDFSGRELDIPGRKIPGQTSPNTLKDEENTLYGQGGDRKKHLQETRDHLRASTSK